MAIQPFAWIRELFTSTARDIDRRLSIVTRRLTTTWRTPTYSWGRADYNYWRRAYYCKAQGLEVSGLFIKPLIHIVAAWVLGRPPTFKFGNSTTQDAITDWWDTYHSEILRAYRSSMKQGDSFIVINSDLTITILAPDTVDPIVADDDYSKIIGWKVRQVFPHPTEQSLKQIVTDDYFADRRVHRVENANGTTTTTVFANLIGVIPVIHIANQPADGERFGHPEAEALVDLLHRYGQVLDAAVEGNILQGRPTPVIAFDTVQNLNAFWRRYGRTETHNLSDGTTQTTDTLEIDMSNILTISGATFDYKSPGAFTEDTERLLGLLFYLILEHVQVPEFAMGNAIEGSKASAETQMPVLETFIRMRQRDNMGWILQIVKVVNAYKAILEPGVSIQDPTVQWAKLTQNGRMVLDSLTWAFGEELVDERTAVSLLPLDIEKPDDVLRQAKTDARKRKRQGFKDQETELKLIANNQPPPTNGGNGGGGTNEMDPSLKEDLIDVLT